MTDETQLAILRRGEEAWNAWRRDHVGLRPDLSKADLHEATLSEADLSEADLTGTDLRGAVLIGANLSGAELRGAILRGANLVRADLIEADLCGVDLIAADLTGADLRGANLRGAVLRGAYVRGADLRWANLRRADLSGADLSGADLRRANLREVDLREADLGRADLHRADLQYATLVETILDRAILSDCRIYGISASGLQLEGTTQTNLIISQSDKPTITVDNLEVAQFLSLMLGTSEIREVINSLTRKFVLILGRFMPERKAVLDALREALRQRNYVPVVFDFEGPENRDVTETVALLARMASFILADLTEPSGIPQELRAIVSAVAVPVQPMIAHDAKPTPFATFVDHREYHWKLPIVQYGSLEELLAAMKEQVIASVEAKVSELHKLRQPENEQG